MKTIENWNVDALKILSMANSRVLISSLICGFVHAWLLIQYPTSQWYQFLLMSGVVSSIWNHADTRLTVKWLDRGIMGIGALTDGIVLSSSTSPLRNPAQGLFVAACVSYGVSKLNPDRLTSDIQHIAAHCFLTIAHCCILARPT